MSLCIWINIAHKGGGSQSLLTIPSVFFPGFPFNCRATTSVWLLRCSAGDVPNPNADRSKIKKKEALFHVNLPAPASTITTKLMRPMEPNTVSRVSDASCLGTGKLWPQFQGVKKAECTCSWSQQPAVQISGSHGEVEHQSPLAVDGLQNMLHRHWGVGVGVLLARLPLHQQVREGSCPPSLCHRQRLVVMSCGDQRS